MTISNEGELTREDLKSWAVTAALFVAPVAIIYLSGVLGAIEDGFAWSDFIPSIFAQGSMVAYILNESLALLKKFATLTRYK